MKKHFLLQILGLLLISTVSIAQQTIIEQLDYESSNTTIFEISKLELRDSITILHCDFYGSTRPDAWVSISSKSILKGKSGHVYRVLRAEGYILDEKVTMPQSGNISFKLYTEPLQKEESYFDFIEGEDEGDFKISGIKTFKPQPPSTHICCILKGDVFGRPQSSRLILTKEGGDKRVSATYIPIREGKFEYVLYCDYVESYELTFYDEYMNGSWRPINFFSDSSTVEFKLFPKDKYKLNVVKGGNENKQLINYLSYEDDFYKTIRAEYDSLVAADNYNSPSFKELHEQRKKIADKTKNDSLLTLIRKMQESGEDLTPEAIDLEKRAEDLSLAFKKWELNYLKENTSVMSYSLLVDKMKKAGNTKEDTPEYIELFHTVYSKKFPSHPYTAKMKNLIVSFSTVKVGGTFIDFSAPDFKGNTVKLSAQIKGKVALIDLWASWCGPCRRDSKSMIPVYEEYKNKGFIVVGIARERELASGINAAEKDGYPWLNLIELDDAGKIWEKYGLGNSGGSSFLVDRDGKILAIHPTAEEVKAKLDELLQ